MLENITAMSGGGAVSEIYSNELLKKEKKEKKMFLNPQPPIL